jgi:hypothetical protein
MSDLKRSAKMMKILNILLFFIVPCGLTAAEITYQELPAKETKVGLVQKTIGERKGDIVYKRLRIDRRKEGDFIEYVEEFFTDKKSVLRISKINGDYIVCVKNSRPTQIELYYRGEQSRPEKILITKSASEAYLYIQDKDGFYIEGTDSERDSLLNGLKLQPEPLKPRSRTKR